MSSEILCKTCSEVCKTCNKVHKRYFDTDNGVEFKTLAYCEKCEKCVPDVYVHCDVCGKCEFTYHEQKDGKCIPVDCYECGNHFHQNKNNGLMKYCDLCDECTIHDEFGCTRVNKEICRSRKCSRCVPSF